MAFLDNSGDIILDAVLTDAGRKRLAKGDGSFRIVKFALSDDEIDYALYQNSNHTDGAHPSGSAYYDLEIMQTPVLEAFTNNTSTMKSHLMSLPRTNLLYLPVIRVNNLEAGFKMTQGGAGMPPAGTFLVAVDEATETALNTDMTPADGLLYGERPNGRGGKIKLDQGLDTTEISPEFTLDSDLVETQYIVKIDNRLGNLCDNNGSLASVSFIDDDNIASYYFSLGSDTGYVSENTATDTLSTEVVDGPRGTTLLLKINSSIELNTSTHLFTELGGSTMTINAINYNFIDTNIRVTGATTGFSVDVPVRFTKKV
jgi:hypothetical protein